MLKHMGWPWILSMAGCSTLFIAELVWAGEVAHDRMHHIERVLTHAGHKSPRWHSHQASIQRDVHDIGYFLELAMKTSDPTAMKDYAEQAWALLQRALIRGHFHSQDIDPVLTEIRRLLPDRPF